MRLFACALACALSLAAPAFAQEPLRTNTEVIGQGSDLIGEAMDRYVAALDARDAHAAAVALADSVGAVANDARTELRFEKSDALIAALAADLTHVTALPRKDEGGEWASAVQTEWIPQDEVTLPRSEADCETVLRRDGDQVTARSFGQSVARNAPPRVTCAIIGENAALFWHTIVVQPHGPGALTLQINFSTKDAAELETVAAALERVAANLSAAVGFAH